MNCWPAELVQFSCLGEASRQLKLIGDWRITEVPVIWTVFAEHDVAALGELVAGIEARWSRRRRPRSVETATPSELIHSPSTPLGAAPGPPGPALWQAGESGEADNDTGEN